MVSGVKVFKEIWTITTASKCLLWRKEHVFFSPHENNNNKNAIVPKSECTDEEMWELCWAALDSRPGPLGRTVLAVKQISPHLLWEHLPCFTPAPMLHVKAESVCVCVTLIYLLEIHLRKSLWKSCSCFIGFVYKIVWFPHPDCEHPKRWG